MMKTCPEPCRRVDHPREKLEKIERIAKVRSCFSGQIDAIGN
jgi:hypothetical protein